MYINIKGRGVSGGKSETNIWTGLFFPTDLKKFPHQLHSTSYKPTSISL